MQVKPQAVSKRKDRNAVALDSEQVNLKTLYTKCGIQTYRLENRHTETITGFLYEVYPVIPVRDHIVL